MSGSGRGGLGMSGSSEGGSDMSGSSEAGFGMGGSGDGARVLRLEDLPTTLHGPRAPIWWGILLLVAIETTVFATLLSSYLYLRLGSTEWPPAGFGLPDLVLPGAITLVLLASAGAVLFALRDIREGSPARMQRWLGAGVALGVVALGLNVFESRDFGAGWGRHAYGSIYWTISGLHTLHLLVAILMAGAILVLARRGYFTPERRVGVQAVTLYWSFVVLIWLPTAFILYLAPRWL